MSASNGNIVTIRNLSKIYQQGEINVTALDNISLDIAAGEFLTLMGPSGSGKSTLLHIIAGIDRPTSGTCHVQGIDVTKLNESELADWRNQNVGFVFQTFNLIPVLTAYENVELPLLLTRLGRAARLEQAGVVGGAALEGDGLGGVAVGDVEELAAAERVEGHPGRRPEDRERTRHDDSPHAVRQAPRYAAFGDGSRIGVAPATIRWISTGPFAAETRP